MNQSLANLPDRVTITRQDRYIASKVVSEEKIEYALSSFENYKTPGLDGIYPAMLKAGGHSLVSALNKIFRACLTWGYIPTAWRKVRVVFIPKPGKEDYALAKSFRPISLTSFLLKCLERLVEKYIRGETLRMHPLSEHQHAYRSGRSCESALHDLVSKIESASDEGCYALGVFVDIEGAFDNATFSSLCNAANAYGVDTVLVRWIYSMLSQRLLYAECGTDTVMKVERGCPQGGVLSPLLWCFLVDSLLDELQSLNIHIQAYADDVCALVCGDSLKVVCSKMQKTLDKIQNWCERHGLSVNPMKTTLVLFTRKRKLDNLKLPTLKGVTIQLSKEVKYLGVILDSKLTWKTHVEHKASRALNAFWQCRRAFGKTWGLKPAIVHWMYIAIIRPIITYASVVWWSRTERKTTCSILNRVQREVCIGITGAFSSTPGAALNAMLNLQPLDLAIQEEAMKAICRLKKCRLWHDAHAIGHGVLSRRLEERCALFSMPTDDMTQCIMFGRRFRVNLPTREEWDHPDKLLDGLNEIFYTDGSKTSTGTGAGWYLSEEIKYSKSLGKTATVFQAEIFAILEVANWIIAHRWHNKRIGICSDSKAALVSLLNPATRSAVTQECKKRLNSVAKHNQVVLIWVPGHQGVEGNEASDDLAKEGADSPPLGPEPIIGVSYAVLKNWITRHVDSIHEQRWSSISTCKFTKWFVGRPDRNTAKLLLSLGRRDCRMLVGTITGHNTCGKHMNTLGIISDPTCPSCGEDEDSTEHFLCNCPAFSRARMTAFGADVMRMENFHSQSLSDVLRFIKQTKKFG